MVRTFEVHKVRKCRELTGSGWTFKALDVKENEGSYDVVTPSCWESYPGFGNYRGRGLYEKKFYACGNVRLAFEGVSHTADVFLDGKKIVHHYNAYTPFGSVVSSLPAGGHRLEIFVDNRFREESSLHVPNDYMTYGGINRPILLEEISEAYIRWVHVCPKVADGKWELFIEVQLSNISGEEKTVEVRADFAGSSCIWENVKIPANEKIILKKNVFCQGVKEWSFEEPNLYEINVRLFENGFAVDDLIDRFGFREISLKDKKICLNGRHFRIKGFCRHEDHPQFAAALPLQAMAYDLDLIQDMGANSVRTSHYPNDQRFLDLCDERGILVWEENHARGLSLQAMQNPNFESQEELVTEEMVEAHFNHPCIYIWGILNECASESEYGKKCYQEEINLIKKMDSSRPVTFASCKYKSDICLGLADVVSFNIYPRWYVDKDVGDYLNELYDWIQNESDGRGKPFVVSEIGAGAIYGFRSANEVKWTEEYQAKALKDQLTPVLENPDCCGLYIWQFCDVRVSEEWFSNRPRCMNNKGIVDEYRRRKLSYNVVKEIFSTYKNYF